MAIIEEKILTLKKYSTGNAHHDLWKSNDGVITDQPSAQVSQEKPGGKRFYLDIFNTWGYLQASTSALDGNTF